MPRRAAALLTAFLLTACAAPPPAAPESEAPPGTVHIAPRTLLKLPRPADLGRGLEVAQLVSARYGEQTFLFEAHIVASPDRFLLVALDTMGRKALTVTWTDAGIDYDRAPWLPKDLRPDNMLADIVVLYWPAEVVNRHLNGATLTAGPRWRSVIREGGEVIHADYANDDPWSGRLSYRNLPWGYQLTIDSMETRR